MNRLWWQRVLALVVKEFWQIVRDPSSYLVAGVLPLLFLLIFGYGVSLDPRVLRIAVLDEGSGAQSASLAAAFAGSPWFQPVPTAGLAGAERAMRNAEIQGFVRLRSDFDRNSRTVAAGPPSIQLVVDGSEPNTAHFIQGYGKQLIARWQALEHADPAVQAGPPVAPEPRYWFNPAAKSILFLVPGSITVIMTLIGTLLTSLVFAREWERGTMEAMLATPVTRLQMLLGKLIPYFFLGMFSLALCTAVGVILFGLPFRGSVLTLVAVSSVFMLTALGQGLLISVLIRTQLVASEAGLFTGFLPALLLSGFIFDIASMPPALQLVARIVPASHFNACLRSIFLAGDVWPVILPHTAALAAIAALLLGVVWKKLSKRID